MSDPTPRPELPERVTTIGARLDAVCFRCRGRNVVLVKLGSEADLVRCVDCGFEFAWEQGEV